MFDTKSRQLFRYFNGEKTVAADPLELSTRMLKSYPKESSLEHDFKLLGLEKEESVDAFMRIAEFARAVFRLKPWNEETETGVTAAEALLTLVDFSEYVEGVKKKLFGRRILQPSTEATASPGAEPNQITNSSSDSGFTETEPSTAAV